MTQLLQFIILCALTLCGMVIDRTTGMLIFTPLLLSYSLGRSRGWLEYTALVGLSLIADAVWQWPLGMSGLISWGLYLSARRALPLGLSTRMVFLLGLVVVNFFLWAL